MERPDPFVLFDLWFAEAQASELNDPNAMALATVDEQGRPSSRMVLLKGHGPDVGGFIFYTNLESRKSGELKVSGPQEDTFTVGDITAGSVQVGDEVRLE